LGLRANARQFALLVALNALVGGMVGLERSVLPLVGKQDFGVSSTSAILAFVVAFGAAKAVTNLAAGGLADRVGRKRLLVLGWLVALPVPLLIGLAPSWWFIVAANLLLGVNQGLAWSMTVVMKIDLAGPRRRGLALGLNESAGYLGVAATAFLTGALPGSARRQRARDRHRRRRLPGGLGWRPAPHRLALRPHGQKAADHGRNAGAGGRARAARRRRRCLRTLARRCPFAWRRHGDGLPDSARSRFGREPAARQGTRGRRISVLARLRLRPRRPDRRDRCRRHLNANRHPHRRAAHRRQRPLRCRDLLAAAARAPTRLDPLRDKENSADAKHHVL